MSSGRYILYCGALAGLASMAALAAAAKAEGRSALQPMNATSHWIHGESAGAVAHVDASHTGAGVITHFASAMFWAVPFGLWLSKRAPRSARRMLCEASLLSAFAAFFDYCVVPRRLTPGWELAVSKRSVAVAFLAMALGLATGGGAAQRKR